VAVVVVDFGAASTGAELALVAAGDAEEVLTGGLVIVAFGAAELGDPICWFTCANTTLQINALAAANKLTLYIIWRIRLIDGYLVV
jgi:hypothetical protein